MAGSNPINLPYYKIKRGNTRFYAMVRGSEKNRHFRELKKSRDVNAIDRDGLMSAAIRNLSFFLSGWCEVVTVPPHSGEGESFAGEIAKRIALKSGAEFREVFRDHGDGKRKHIKAKFKVIDADLQISLNDMKILLFDDFTLTGNTMVSSIEALEKNNNIIGVVLGC